MALDEKLIQNCFPPSLIDELNNRSYLKSRYEFNAVALESYSLVKDLYIEYECLGKLFSKIFFFNSRIKRFILDRKLEKFDYMGCYGNWSIDKFDGITKDDCSHTRECVEFCAKNSYLYAGTFKRLCFCGNELDEKQRVSSCECNIHCTGEQGEICGGENLHWSVNKVFYADVCYEEIKTSYWGLNGNASDLIDKRYECYGINNLFKTI